MIERSTNGGDYRRFSHCGLMALALLVACGDNEPVDSGGGAELLMRVRAADYRAWPRAPGWQSRLPSVGGGHGGELDIYVNEAIATVLARGTPVDELPVGSTIIKDVWRGADFHAIAIMDKRSDGWYWAEFTGDGEVSAAGHPRVCIDCHQRGKDYVRAFALP